MKKLLLVLMLAGLAMACEPVSGGEEDFAPAHLVLGQRLKFLGSSPETTYLIVGYRGSYEGTIEKNWKSQEYIVFTYINDLNDVSTGTIHLNSVIKD